MLTRRFLPPARSLVYSHFVRLMLMLWMLIAIVSASPARAQTTEPVPGVWRLSGRARGTACVEGRCASQRQAIDETIVLTNTGIGAAAGIAAGCSNAVSSGEFDGVLTTVPGRRGWFRFRVVDRPRFRELIRLCLGYRSLRVSRFSGRVRIAADGRSLDEVGFLAGSLTVSGRTATFSVRARIHGQWVGEAAGSPAPAFLAEIIDAGGAK